MNAIAHPLVSVIIPCFNAERFLRETLDSVLRQTWPRFEVIAVDDGSVDRTRHLIASYGDKVRLVACEVNRGASAARNRGTAQAQGEYLQYLDSDDLLRPEAIARKVDALRTSGADAAYSDWQKLQESSEGAFQAGPALKRALEDVDKDSAVALLTDFWCPPAAWLFRRAVAETVGGWNESMTVIEDARFVLEAALRGARFVHVPGIEADYRLQRKGFSLSQKDPAAFLKGIVANARRAEGWWETHGGISAPQRAALMRVYRGTARQLFWRDGQACRESLKQLCHVWWSARSGKGEAR
jgi:glycosyltransferase involved in cell wall biosynthesis